MKKILLSAMIVLALSATAQDKEKVPAAKGVIYGQVSEEKFAIAVNELNDKLVDNTFAGQIIGRVAEVCRAEGCWIRLKKADGTTMTVRAKDHAFLMPENIVGKTVLIEGSASVKETSEEMRKHYAEDAGKSKDENCKNQRR
jgi:hypothetical protein